MQWNEGILQWMMNRAYNNKFIMHFFDCTNLNKAFPHLNKKKRALYGLTIKFLGYLDEHGKLIK